jgi:shikimate kinase
VKIFLIGFMGAGKTSKGRALSRKLGIRFADMDQLIEEEEGMSVQDIFSSKGEEWFRNKETEVLHMLGEIEEDMVVSTGGGVPCFNNNLEYINSRGVSIYLRMTADALATRLSGIEKNTRPLLKGKSRDELLEYITLKLNEREPFYLRSKHIIQAEKLKIEDIEAFLQA